MTPDTSFEHKRNFLEKSLSCLEPDPVKRAKRADDILKKWFIKETVFLMQTEKHLPMKERKN